MEDIFNYTIFTISGYSLRVAVLIKLASLLVVTLLLLSLIKNILYKSIKIESSRKYSVYQLIKYLIVVINLLFVLRIIGLDLTVLMASLAALLVGLGFGLQNLFSDYMSGIIILFDSSIKVNDIIDVNGTVGQVIKIGLRTTTVKTRSDQYIILPNTKLTSTELINWTHQAGSTRFEINIGVDYSSDIHLVMKLLKKAAIDQDGVLNSPEPFVRFNEYGDSALLFSLYFWADEVFRVENIKSQLRIRLFDLFKANEINIPFPQRVLHIKHNDKEKLPE
ncbi:MAG: mechanosensitive ion channel [Ignavibacteriaceae bacterium]|jgi:small-conductance mechanosensitive channel|nr:mechanosensitive ion channel [Ignavibacteriaceae bacterium]